MGDITARQLQEANAANKERSYDAVRDARDQVAAKEKAVKVQRGRIEATQATVEEAIGAVTRAKEALAAARAGHAAETSRRSALEQAVETSK